MRTEIKDALIETLEGMDTVYFGSDNQYWVEFVTNGYFSSP